MRVCHLITSLATGGAETALFRLLTGPGTNPQDVSVISLTDLGTYGPQLREAGIKVAALGMTRGRMSISAFVQLVRIVRAARPDILQTWLYHADLLGLLAGKVAGVSHIAWNIRCSVTDERYVAGQAGVVLRLLAALSRLPDAVIANSEAGLQVHRALGYRPRLWRVIPNGVDSNLFKPDPDAYRSVRQELGLSSDSILIGLVARFDPLKDHLTFLRTAALVLAATKTDAHFIAVGAGVTASNPALTETITSLGIGDRMHLLGERRDTPRLNAALDVAMCTSTGEGFPNVLIEAMACAVPCVSTAAGDAALVIGDTGFTAPVGDAAALAGSVLRLTEIDKQHREVFGAAARQRVQQNYSLSAMIDHYRDFYTSLVDEGG